MSTIGFSSETIHDLSLQITMGYDVFADNFFMVMRSEKGAAHLVTKSTPFLAEEIGHYATMYLKKVHKVAG